MRTTVLIAVSLLLAGCSHGTVGQPERAQTTASESPQPSGASVAPLTAPQAGAPIADVIGWIEAGQAADAAHYHSATNAGETTDLGDDVAFTAPPAPESRSGAITCMTDSAHTGGALACLVDLTDPPPRPEGVYGEWKGNWVDFDGVTLQVGSAHGDPGPFRYGDGPQLPSGAALSFGDYRCRTERTDLFCVNYAHRSAARLGRTGVVPFGCLHPVPPPEGVGALFSC